MAPLPLLKGDYLNGKEPTDWMQQFQLNLPPSWTDAQKVDRFILQCTRGRPAHIWVSSLSAAQMATWVDLITAYEAHWPTTPPVFLVAAQKKERLKALTLKEGDIGVMIDNEKGQEWGHIHWACQVQQLAQSFNDVNCQYLDVVLEGVPDLLHDQLSDLYLDWGAFVTGVNNMSINLLSRAQAKAKEEKEMRILKHVNIPDPDPRVSAKSVSTVRTTDVPTGNIPAQMQLPTQQLTLNNPLAAAGTVPRTNLFYRYQPPQTPIPMHASIAERIRIASQYAGLSHQPDTDAGRSAHAQQVKEWHEKHGMNAVPHIGSPYLLKLGTAPLGSQECFACGLVTTPTHQAAGCPHPPLTFQEAKWWELVSSLVGRTLRNTMIPMTPNAPIQPSMPVQFIATTNAYVPQYPVPDQFYHDFSYPWVQEYHKMGMDYTPTLPTLAMSPEFASEILSALLPTSSALLDSGLVSEISSSSASMEEDATPSDTSSDSLLETVDVELPTIEMLNLPDSPMLTTLDACLADSSYVLPVVKDSSSSDDLAVASISTTNEPLNLYSVEGPQASHTTGRPFITQITLFGEEGQALCFHAHVDDGAMVNAIDTKVFLKASGRLLALRSSQRTLQMANGSIEISNGVWEGDIKWGNTKAHTIFEVFPSGGAWKALIGKPLLEQLKAIHDYAMDVIMIPAPSSFYLQPSTLLNLFGTNTVSARTRTKKDERSNKEVTTEQTESLLRTGIVLTYGYLIRVIGQGWFKALAYTRVSMVH
ncbi:hypothetical protein F4604DRAFT_1930339 [Suillus subluteus]|nr:hypothetical protein F4604DRAFT_1930339 [Suillus subluteus]